MDQSLIDKAERAITIANNNDLFYTMSPPLLLAIMRSFGMIAAKTPALLHDRAYYEFGIFKGFSLWFASQTVEFFDARNFACYGFDSFEGMGPSVVDAGNPYWRPGAYAAPMEYVIDRLRRYGAKNVRLFKGFFTDALFRDMREKVPLLPCAVCTIDCDIYEGAIACLRFITDKLALGSFILFDDFDRFVLGNSDEHGERRALKDWLAENPSIRLDAVFRFDKGAAFRVAAL